MAYAKRFILVVPMLLVAVGCGTTEVTTSTKETATEVTTTTSETATAVGIEEQLADALDPLSTPGSVLDERGARCFAAGVVDELDVERLVALGAALPGAEPAHVS